MPKDTRGGKRGGGGGSVEEFDSRTKATNRTAQAVKAINELVREGGKRSDIREQLNNIREGQQITTYSSERTSDGREIEGVANDPIVWTKREDGEWSSNTGSRIDNSGLMRQFDAGRRLGAGEITTESHTQITGRMGREIGGLRYAEGQYDVIARGTQTGGQVRKMSQSGQITYYQSTAYGVTKNGKTYEVTHIGTGLKTTTPNDNLKTLTDVSNHIKSIDPRIKAMPSIKQQEERFEKTIRGD